MRSLTLLLVLGFVCAAPARAQVDKKAERNWKAKCASCHTPPFYLDHQMHDLQMERFLKDPPDGPIKTFTLRGIKESPPYMHDGRCLTLEDTVEFFNLVLCLKLTAQEKANLVSFMQAL